MNETPAPARDETITLRRVDTATNMARFYALTLEPTLFGEITVMRHWGRIGTRGRSKSCFHGTLEAARTALAKQAGRKRRRGYVPLCADPPSP